MTSKFVLADDHDLIRVGLRNFLTEIPQLEIIGEASNGIELKHIIDTKNPDILILDANMPDFDPVSDIKHIKNRKPNLKILIISAYDDESYINGLLGVGVDGYHLKDQPLSDLKTAVEKIINGEKWISTPILDKLIDMRTSKKVKPQIKLTSTQQAMLQMLLRSYSNKKIAWQMNISVKTVENRLTSLYRLLGVQTRLEATNFAINNPQLLSKSKIDETLYERKQDLSLRVLIVDDNPLFRQELGKLIYKASNLELFEAEDTYEAVMLAEQIHLHLIFIDVVLRDEYGIQCAKQINAISPNSRIILMSAYPDQEFRRLGMEAGAIAYLDKKDIDSATIKNLIQDAISGSLFPENL